MMRITRVTLPKSPKIPFQASVGTIHPIKHPRFGSWEKHQEPPHHYGKKNTPWFPVEFSLGNPWILSQAFASLAFRAQRVTPKRRRVEWSSDVNWWCFFRRNVAGFDHEKLDLKPKEFSSHQGFDQDGDSKTWMHTYYWILFDKTWLWWSGIWLIWPRNIHRKSRVWASWDEINHWLKSQIWGWSYCSGLIPNLEYRVFHSKDHAENLLPDHICWVPG